MQTNSQAPWIDEYQGKEFRKAAKEIKEKFVFNEKLGIYPKNIDETLWRHWNLSFAINYALSFVKSDEFNLVECGVEWGYTAFFALKTLSDTLDNTQSFTMHLYDAWQDMKQEELLESEYWHVNLYKNLDIDSTKQNLNEFSQNLVFHQGYIPESLNKKPDAPDSIFYLHIDLNSAKPTESALDFFYPRLVPGGVILFDDYGWDAYEDTKNAIENFFTNKPGILMKLPTGQAIYFHNN